MKLNLSAFWNSLRSSFWFLPAVMVLVTAVLSVVIVRLDQVLPFEYENALIWFRRTSPEGARSLLSTVAGSMISVAGVTFSITIVALAQTSSQYGPRLLNNFIRDRGNQIVLGTFVSNFVYCLLILRTIRSVDDASFVPQVSVTFAILLTILSVGVLIYFIHHISTSLQAEHIISDIGQELDTAIKQLVGDEKSSRAYERELRDKSDIPDDFDANAQKVSSNRSGYLQRVDYNHLRNIAIEHDLLLRLLTHAGEFVVKEDDILAVWPAQEISEDLHNALDDAFAIGLQRIHGQDVELAIHELVEIAVRALSTGINDPFTAVSVINQLTTSLAELAERTIPGGFHYDEDGKLRVIEEAVTFSDLIESAFDQIRQYGRSNVEVMIRLMEALTIIAARAHKPGQKEALETQAEMIMRACADTIPEPNDRDDIQERYQMFKRVLAEA